MLTPGESMAVAELARASRLERMANDLLIEAREIRSTYTKPKKKAPAVSMVTLAKQINADRRR